MFVMFVVTYCKRNYLDGCNAYELMMMNLRNDTFLCLFERKMSTKILHQGFTNGTLELFKLTSGRSETESSSTLKSGATLIKVGEGTRKSKPFEFLRSGTVF